jgi:hypothetical protein
MQLDIVEVTTALAQHVKADPSVAIIGAVSDVMRHLRKSIHCSLDDANLGAEIKNWNKNLREVVDKCLTELAYKVALISINSYIKRCFFGFENSVPILSNPISFHVCCKCFIYYDQLLQDFQRDKKLVAIGEQVGDAGPILDIMAVMLENISNITVIARTMISAVYRTAQIVASLPNLSYQNKAKPNLWSFSMF